MKKLFVLCIAVCAIFTAKAQWDGTSAPWTQGNGTQTNPYLIETPQHLAFLSDMVNAGVSNYQGQYFLLTQDISLSNQSWVPIGDASHPFKGHFNGGGHIIDSVLIDNNNYNNRGLWGYIDNGSVKKVVCGVEITTNGSVGAGGIVQTATNGTLIADCKVYGSISGHVCVGGIVGNLILGEVRGCENYATVTGSDKVGGVVGGFVGSDNRRVVSKCSNYGNIHSTGTLNLVSQTTVGNPKHLYYESYIGGVVGYAVCSTDTVSLCFNKGHISSQGDYRLHTVNISSYSSEVNHKYCIASGICAQSMFNSSTIHHAIVATCYNTGNIQVMSTTGGYDYSSCMYTIGVAFYVANGCYSTGTRSITSSGNTPITTVNQVNYGVGYYCNDNNYYLNTVSTYGCGSPRTDANMKSVSFPTMLNTDSVVYVMDEFGINDGYPVFAWQTIYNVTTDNASNVTSYTASLNGHYGGTADSTGFMYWQQGGNDTVRVPLTPATTLQYQLSALQPGTTYGYKIYVNRSGHTAYGAAVTFTTHPLYTVSVASSNAAWGSVSGGGTFAYGETTTLQATATTNNYRFVQWSDGNTQNPRIMTVTQNVNLTAQFGPAIYTITVSSANSAWGVVSGGGSFEYGQSATISATAATGYHFVQWSDGNSNNPRTIVVNGDMYLTATFAPNLYNVTVLPNNSDWGSVTGSGVYAYGSVDTLTATPANNFIFNQWSDGNTNNPRHLVITGDTTITAQFSPGSCTLTLLSNNNAWGTVSGGGTYPYSQSVTCTATPELHYHFVSWDDGNTSNPRAYILTGNTTLTALFAPDQHTITVLSGNSTMGTVSGGGTFDYGTIDTIRATAYNHYLFQGWSDGNSENPRYIQVTGDMTLTAQFNLASYVVNLSVNNTAWGSVLGAGSYTYGTLQVIAAQPATGYHFSQWSDGNTDNPRMITISGDTNLVAIFSPNQYTVSVYSSDTTKGTVSGGGVYNYGQQTYIIATPLGSYTFSQWSDGNTEAFRSIIVTQNVSYTALFTDAFFEITGESNNPIYGNVIGGGSFANGSTITLTAVANPGYHFVQWSDGSTENPRTVTVNANATYYAQFAVNNYTINVTSSDVSQGSVTGGGIYSYLTTVTMQATPTQYHRFVQWNDGITTNPRIITVTSDSTFIAQFEPMEQYTITVVSDNPERGTVTGGGTFYAGTQVQITATPLPNNNFTHWSDGNAEAIRTITVTENTTYTAYFEAVHYTVSVFSNDPNLGSVAGGGSYEYGSSATVTATPTQGNHFVRWSNGAEDNPYTFTVYNDVNLIATFQQGVGIDNHQDREWYAIAQNGSIILKNLPKDEPVSVYDMLGKLLYSTGNSEESEMRIPVSAVGVYIVRVGDQSFKKIVVTK